MNKKRIFVGGTGRSGTTILSKFIGSHEEMKRIPFESRFIIDYNGLVNIYDALHNNYSIDQGRIALRQFSELMSALTNGKHNSPYLGHPLWKYNLFVQKRTKKLREQLSDGDFKGSDYRSIDNYKSRSYLRNAAVPVNRLFKRIFRVSLEEYTRYNIFGIKSVKPLENITIPKYFRDDKELIIILKKYIEDIFKEVISTDIGWCEDTPANIYNIEFLNKLFPDSYFIHAMRHPVGVAFSMKKKIWAPSDIEYVCNLLENLYERSIYCHEWALKNNKSYYLFQRLEDLTSEEEKNKLTKFINLDENKYSGTISIDDNKMNYYINSISNHEMKYIQKRLAKYIEYFGYKLF